MKPKPTPKKITDPEVYLKRAVRIADSAPRHDREEIEEAIREYGRALLRAAGRKLEKAKCLDEYDD